MATSKNGRRKRKRKIGTVDMRTGEFKPVKREGRQANKDPGDKHRWETLEELIQQLADAQEADSWKGGGDPEYIPVIEAELELAKLKLRTHIDHMRNYYEGTQ